MTRIEERTELQKFMDDLHQRAEEWVKSLPAGDTPPDPSKAYMRLFGLYWLEL